MVDNVFDGKLTERKKKRKRNLKQYLFGWENEPIFDVQIKAPQENSNKDPIETWLQYQKSFLEHFYVAQSYS
jgi:hypothetical protein